jgi:hypothetical protein
MHGTLLESIQEERVPLPLWQMVQGIRERFTSMLDIAETAARHARQDDLSRASTIEQIAIAAAWHAARYVATAMTGGLDRLPLRGFWQGEDERQRIENVHSLIFGSPNIPGPRQPGLKLRKLPGYGYGNVLLRPSYFCKCGPNISAHYKRHSNLSFAGVAANAGNAPASPRAAWGGRDVFRHDQDWRISLDEPINTDQEFLVTCGPELGEAPINQS